MKSWRTAAIGLAVASAMVVVPVMASANEDASDAPAQQQTTQTTQTVTKTEHAVASSPAASPKAQSNDAGRSQSANKPQAQGDPDASMALKVVDSCPVIIDPTTQPSALYFDRADATVLHVCPGVMVRTGNRSNYYYKGVIYNAVEAASPGASSRIKRVVFDDPANTHLAGYVSRMFASLENVVSFDGIGRIDTSQATDISELFADDGSVTSLPITSWNTSKVGTDEDGDGSTEGMFASDGALTSLDLHTGPNGQWDVSHVESMAYMFEGVFDYYGGGTCIDHLKTIDLRGWDTSAVYSMGEMFYGRGDLAEIKGIDHWDVSNCLSFEGMFRYDVSLQLVGLGGWHPMENDEWAINTDSMFDETGITELDLSGLRNSSFFSAMEGSFPQSVRKIVVGPDTVFLPYHDFKTEINAGMKCTDFDYFNCVADPAYTGHWLQLSPDDDGTGLPAWVSPSDNGLASLGYACSGIGCSDAELAERITQSNKPGSGVGPGTYLWQQSKIVISYLPNAPKDTTVSMNGTPGALIPQQVQDAGNADRSLTPNVTPNPQGTYTAVGWRVASWNTKADGSGKTISVSNPEKVHFHSGDITLYAQWESVPVNVNVTPVPSSPSNPNPNPAPNRGPAPAPAPAPSSGPAVLALVPSPVAAQSHDGVQAGPKALPGARSGNVCETAWQGSARGGVIPAAVRCSTDAQESALAPAASHRVASPLLAVLLFLLLLLLLAMLVSRRQKSMFPVRHAATEWQ